MKRRVVLLALVPALAPALAMADDGDRPVDKKLALTPDEKVSTKGDDGDDAVKAPGTTAMCIDQEIADRLAIKRKRRGAVDRLFVKQRRHEISHRRRLLRQRPAVAARTS